MLGILHSIHCRGLFHDPQCSVVLRVYTVCGGGPIPIPGPLLTYQIPSAHKTNKPLLKCSPSYSCSAQIRSNPLSTQDQPRRVTGVPTNPCSSAHNLSPSYSCSAQIRSDPLSTQNHTPDLQHQRKTTDSSKRGGTRLSDSLSTHSRTYTSLTLPSITR